MTATTTEAMRVLRYQVSRLETGSSGREQPSISCGSPLLDRLLPGGGLTAGTLNEWVEHQPGSGGSWLSLLAARHALHPLCGDHASSVASESHGAEGQSLGRNSSGRHLVIIDTGENFYPPAAQAAGLEYSQLAIIRPKTRSDALWAADQALRSPAVAAVWGPIDRLDDREARRLQLAAELGNTLGLWLRPHSALREPSWSEVRWYVRGCSADTFPSTTPHASVQRSLEVRLVRCRGGRSGQTVLLQIDSAGQLTHGPSQSQASALPLASQLAHPKVVRRASRQRA